MMKLEKHIDVDSDNVKAVDVLSESTAISKQLIKKAMQKGAVWVTKKNSTQRLRRADKLLKSGSTIHLYYDEQVLSLQPADAIMIADEGLYSVWYKPYGMLSQGSKWGDHCAINRWVEKNLQPQRPSFVVHRLDRAATGLMLIAHGKKTAAYFSNLFQQRQVEKQYRAIVTGKFPDYLKLDTPVENKSALSHAEIIKYDTSANKSLVSVSIETGRKHQIRRHLSEAGFPIVGDRLYGNNDDNHYKDLCLTSCYLSFVSPANNRKKEYILPDELLLDLE